MKKQQCVRLAEKQLCTCSALFCTFICRCFTRLQRETFRNFLVARFMDGGNVDRVLVHFFFLLALIFTLVMLGGCWHFSFSHHRYKVFMLFFQQKMSPFLFFSRSSSLPLFFSLSFDGLLPTFSFSIFQICGHDNVRLIP